MEIVLFALGFEGGQSLPCGSLVARGPANGGPRPIHFWLCLSLFSKNLNVYYQFFSIF